MEMEQINKQTEWH